MALHLRALCQMVVILIYNVGNQNAVFSILRSWLNFAVDIEDGICSQPLITNLKKKSNVNFSPSTNNIMIWFLYVYYYKTATKKNPQSPPPQKKQYPVNWTKNILIIPSAEGYKLFVWRRVTWSYNCLLRNGIISYLKLYDCLQTKDYY